MKNKHMKTLVLAAALLASNLAINAEVPKGWFVAGSHPKEYKMEVDRETRHQGKSSAQLKSIASKPGGFGTLMQMFAADSFHGQRVRMSGYVRSDKVEDWAGLWMRIDGAKGEPLGFDNMQDRAIKNTTDWVKYEIVLDVPAEAKDIAFGLLLSGSGTAWMDDLKFEVVGKDVPVTGKGSGKTASKGPANLNFEE